MSDIPSSSSKKASSSNKSSSSDISANFTSSNSEPVEETDWKIPGNKRLLAGGYFKGAQGLITGSFMGLWGLVILPRLIPQPEVFGIISMVATYLGLIGTCLDWGCWTAYQMIMAKAIGVNDQNNIIKYTRTIVAFKIINSLIFNGIVFLFLAIWWPKIFLNWREAYQMALVFITIRAFGSFMSIWEHLTAASHRFDYEFYISLVHFAFVIVSKLFWLWICNTFWFPAEPIIANVSAIVISETFEIILAWILQAWAFHRLALIPLNILLIPHLDRECFVVLLKYGTSITLRSYALAFADVNSFLWILFVNLLISEPEMMVGYWVVALSFMGTYQLAANLNRPIFPAIADAHHRQDQRLLQGYWITTMKWNYLWSFLALGLYLGWGKAVVIALAGDSWELSGQIVQWIAVAFLFRMTNDYFALILNGINKPYFALCGTLIKIPVLIGGALITFQAQSYIGMAMVFTIMELVQFIFLSAVLKHQLHMKTPLWIVFIPAIACFGSLGVSILIERSIKFPSVLANVVIMYTIFILIFFAFFLWMGGFEIKDFVEYEQGLKYVFKHSTFPHNFIYIIQRFSQLSPLYGRFSTEI